MQRHKSFYGGLILIESILLGIGNPIAKYGMTSFPFFMYVSIRFLLGGVFLYTIFHKKINRHFQLSFLKPGTLIAIFTAGAYIVGTLAFKYTTATNAGFLFALPVIFTPFLMHIISKTKLQGTPFLIIVIVVAGLYLLCCGNGGFKIGPGEGLAILSAFLGACVYELSAKYLNEIEPFFLAAYQAAFIGIVCLILSIVSQEKLPSFASIPYSAWGALIYLGIGCTGVGYCLQNSALAKITSSKMSLIMCTQPIFTAAASFFLLGERMTPIQFVGGIIIMASVLWASVGSKNNF